MSKIKFNDYIVNSNLGGLMLMPQLVFASGVNVFLERQEFW